MRIEVRAVGLKAMREKRGLRQPQLAQDLGMSQNYIPGIEARRPSYRTGGYQSHRTLLPVTNG
jgi:transcriptional regulator with XRE-family HTH domain